MLALNRSYGVFDKKVLRMNLISEEYLFLKKVFHAKCGLHFKFL